MNYTEVKYWVTVGLLHKQTLETSLSNTHLKPVTPLTALNPSTRKYLLNLGYFKKLGLLSAWPISVFETC